jgi:NTP pyrophosphatase (non-canonical NTP hydrolase)
MSSLDTARIIDAIILEMVRQDEKWGSQRHLDPDKWNTILGEEVGEVAHAVNEHDRANLIEELVQVAAVCVQWLKALG